VFGDDVLYLTENQQLKLSSFEGEIIDFELPAAVEQEVAESEMAVAGDTATGATKQVITVTGLKVTVPLFVNVGDVIRIDTRNGDYVTRVSAVPISLLCFCVRIKTPLHTPTGAFGSVIGETHDHACRKRMPVLLRGFPSRQEHTGMSTGQAIGQNAALAAERLRAMPRTGDPMGQRQRTPRPESACYRRVHRIGAEGRGHSMV
jgi:hypothetical protein